MSDKTPKRPKQDEAEPPIHQAPIPRPVAMTFAGAFVLAMFFNLYVDATSVEYEGGKITMFLGAAALLTLGVDVGRMIGRK